MNTRFSAFFALMCAACALTLPWGVTGSAVAQNRAPAAQRQRPNGAGFNLIQKLEAQLGAPLSAEQKRQIAEAGRATREALIPAQNQFVQQVSQAIGVSEAQIRAMMPTIGQQNNNFDKNIIPKIEAILGRSLTAQEIAEIGRADREKKAAMLPVQDSFAQQISQITGLPAMQIKGLLPQIVL
jgi:hypothetical protein